MPMIEYAIKLKGFQEENLQDYKKAGIFLAFPSCDWKCLTEKGLDISICQNSHLANEPTEEYDLEFLWQSYIKNPLTECWIFGGLEPFKDYISVVKIINFIRNIKNCNDEIVIYTGYYPEEIKDKLEYLKTFFGNIIIKFGRYIQGLKSRYDKVLGVNLISENQYAIRL